MTDPTTEIVPLIRARHAAAIEAWSWHDATDDTLAGYGFHMSQILARLPRDGETRDIKDSIDFLIEDLGALLDLLDGRDPVCVHCGDTVTNPSPGDWWTHARRAPDGTLHTGKSRCQSPDVAYGHLAHPADVPCRADGPNPCLGARGYSPAVTEEADRG